MPIDDNAPMNGTFYFMNSDGKYEKIADTVNLETIDVPDAKYTADDKAEIKRFSYDSLTISNCIGKSFNQLVIFTKLYLGEGGNNFRRFHGFRPVRKIKQVHKHHIYPSMGHKKAEREENSK